MPIKGISDQKVLPRLGKIRTGIKKISQKGSEYPEEVPYFVLNATEEVVDKNGNVIGQRENEHIAALIDMFGEQPHELPVAFPIDDLSMVADPFMKWWGGDVKKKKAVLNCRGDGEYAVYYGKDHVSGLDGKIPEHKIQEGFNRICNKDLCPQAKSGHCKPNMNLRFVIPSYSLYGVFQIDTTSFQAMESILSSIDVARRALSIEGINSIAGVPLRLFRERTPNRHGGVNYILKLEVNLGELKTQKNLLTQRKASTLALGLEKYTVEVPLIDEPNYDLLPQSEHGRAQTGEEIEPVETQVLPPAGPEEWVKDATVVEKFTALADLTNQTATEARMLATARKFKKQPELVAYLDEKLAAGASQPSA